jgi:hypothetical protein
VIKTGMKYFDIPITRSGIPTGFHYLKNFARGNGLRLKIKYSNTTKEGFCDWLDAKMTKDTSYD